MIAAIYARKSTGQRVADDAKSVTRQVENARRFAADQGWTVEDDYIYIDDGISGAETSRLLNKQRLIEQAMSGACPFDVVVMQAQDRFSRRDGDEAFTELKQLARKVQVWFYADRRRFDHGTLATNVVGLLGAEFAAEFRRAIAQKTHESLRRRAELGHVTGGRVFGYDNVRRDGFVERVVNKKEAAVVRDIYRRYADGAGYKEIAHALNAAKVPSPRPQRNRPAGWDPGTVRAVLRRALYRGLLVYDRTEKRNADGSRHRGRQPKKDESQWVKKDMPALRLVSVELAEKVDARLEGRKNTYLRDTRGRLLGSPRRHGHNVARHLLAGFIVCACGATFEAVRGHYVCSARRRKGPDVCGSSLSFLVDEIDQIFLDALEEVVLARTFIDRVLDATFAHDPHAARAALVIEEEQLGREIENLTKGIALGGDIPTLAAALAERDRRRTLLKAQLARPVSVPDRDALRAALELRTADWRDVLRGPHVQQARVVLQHLIELPIRVVKDVPALTMIDAPGVLLGDPREHRWKATVRPEGLTVGLIQSVASPTGFEPVFWP